MSDERERTPRWPWAQEVERRLTDLEGFGGRLEDKVDVLEERAEALERRTENHSHRMQTVERRLKEIEGQTSGLIADVGMHDTTLTQHGKRISKLEGGGQPEPPDISKWTDEFFQIEAQRRDAWLGAARGYADASRHVVDAYLDIAIATGEPGPLNDALFFGQELARVYGEVPRNRTADLRMFMFLARLAKLSNDGWIKAHAAKVLDDVRDLVVGGPNGDVLYREFSHRQNEYPFSFPGRWGAWQGQGTAVFLLASLVDTGWYVDMKNSWLRELEEKSGTWGAAWGAAWELNEVPYEHARTVFKAGREVGLIDAHVDPMVFVKAWAQAFSAGVGTWTATAYIDGTSPPGHHEASQIYEGWARLGAWSLEVRMMTDHVLAQTQGSMWWNLNDSDSLGVRRARLLAARARAEIEAYRISIEVAP